MSPLSSAIIDTWRRFYRDPLAVIGAIALMIIIEKDQEGPQECKEENQVHQSDNEKRLSKEFFAEL